jgi:GntR family transcriptional regulator
MVLLPRLKLKPGQPIFEQIVFAAIRAFVSGEYQPGQPFPSVRALAADLKINPTTAHKVIQHLIQERWLEAHSGLGTVVAKPPLARSRDRKQLLEHELEQLVVEAKRLGLTMTDLVDGIAVHWNKLDKDQEVANQSWSKLTTSGSGSAILKRSKA